jgi:hypothetical protein
MLFIAAGTASAKDPITKWIDPHDSLTFDGEGNIFISHKLADSCSVWILGHTVRGIVKGSIQRDKTKIINEMTEVKNTSFTQNK